MKRPQLLAWGVYSVLLLLSICGVWLCHEIYGLSPMAIHDASYDILHKVEPEQLEPLYDEAKMLTRYQRNIAILMVGGWAMFGGIVLWTSRKSRTSNTDKSKHGQQLPEPTVTHAEEEHN
jgi:hypothetical protein